MKVRVRPYVRRSHERYLRARPPSLPGNLDTIIDDVVAGRRSGYTWTARWRFDVNDTASMKQVYNKLGDRTMYVVATTNRTLAEFERDLENRVSSKIDANQGIGLWRRDDGAIFVDDIVLFFGPKVSEFWALNYASNRGQEYILKIDGKTRTYEFLNVPGWATS